LLSSASQLSIYGQQLHKHIHASHILQYDCHIAVHGMELSECKLLSKTGLQLKPGTADDIKYNLR
jgi:hypothetical protein